MYKRFASCRLLDWWEETFLMFALWWIFTFGFCLWYIDVLWGVEMIKHLEVRFAEWMIHDASEWWQKRVKQRLLVAEKLGQTSSPLGWIWMGRKIGSEKNACAFVERRNPDLNKQQGGENVNKRRYWWQERPSFTSSILTISPTIGNGSTQVWERTQKFFE